MNSSPGTDDRPVPPHARLRALVRADPGLAERAIRLLTGEPSGEQVVRPELAAAVSRPLLAGRETEALVAMALDCRRRVIEAAILTTGCDGCTVVDPRQIYRWALTRSRPAASIILAHNHPSGDPTPSTQDRRSTERVAAAGKVLHVPLVDHLVVADPDTWVSMGQMGLLS